VKLIFSYGKLNQLSQTASIIQTVNYNITYAMAMRETPATLLAGSGLESTPDWIINGSISLPGADLKGLVFWDINGDGSYSDGDIIIEDAKVVIENTTVGFHQETTTSLTGYTFTGVAPKVVSVYAIVNGHKITVASIDMVPNSNNTRNVAIKPASIGGTLRLPSNVAASGVSLQLKDLTNGTIMTTVTNATGAFYFSMLLPGDFTLSATDTGLTLGTQDFNLVQAEKITKVIYVGNAIQVSGHVTYNGVPVAYARVLLSNEITQIWGTADANGEYSITAPAGSYTIYAIAAKDGLQLAYLDKITTSIPETRHIALTVAKVLTGRAVFNNASATSATVVFKASTGAVMRSVTNTTGGFMFVVPANSGTSYELYIGGTYKGAYWESINFPSSMVANYTLQTTAWVNGTVWYDSNHNGVMTTAKGLQNALVTVISNGTQVSFATSSTGKYGVILPKGGNYSFVVSILDFDSQYFAADNLQSDLVQNYSMVPSLRPVSGQLSGLSVEVTFSFDAVPGSGGVTQGVTTYGGGQFSTELRPGVYTVKLDQNVTDGSDLVKYQLLAPVTLTISIGDVPTVLMLDAVERVLVNGTVTAGSATLRYMSPTLDDFTFTANGTYSLYLQRGEYSLWGVLNGTPNLGILEKVTVAAPMTYDVAFTSEAFTVSLNLTYASASAGVPISYTIANVGSGAWYLGSTSNAGTASVVLPGGVYSILVDDRTVAMVDGNPRFLRFGVYTTFSVIMNHTVDVAMTRAYDNSTVSGLPANTSVRFLAMNATAMSVPFQPSSFVASLAPGMYSVYVKQDLGTDVYLGTVTVQPYTPISFSLALVPGTRVIGTTSINAIGTQATVTFTSAGATADVTTAADGTYEIYLPAGTYSAVASTVITDRGVNITYRDTATVVVSGSVVGASFDMQKIVDHGVKLEWNTQERRVINPGETATYNIKVTNTGNVDDTYKLSAYKYGWNLTLPSNVTVPYGSSVTVVMNLTPELGSGAGSSSIDVTGTSLSDATAIGRVSVTIEVRATYAVNMTYSKAETVSSNQYIYDITLKNTGNLLDTFAVNCTNWQYLHDNGWNVSLKYSTSNYSDSLTVRLSRGESGTVLVRLVPIRAVPNPSVIVVLVATSQGSSSVSTSLTFTPEFPNLAVVGNTFSVTGPKVHSSDFQVPGDTYVLLGVSLVLVVLVVFLSMRKGVLGRGKR
jgi:dolichyl-diphosphooligosaccharide--protein glycosyltransferase